MTQKDTCHLLFLSHCFSAANPRPLFSSSSWLTCERKLLREKLFLIIQFEYNNFYCSVIATQLLEKKRKEKTRQAHLLLSKLLTLFNFFTVENFLHMFIYVILIKIRPYAYILFSYLTCSETNFNLPLLHVCKITLAYWRLC